MLSVARTDTSVIGRWWWTVDRWMLAALLLLVVVGALLTLAASPAVAERIGLGSFHFAERHILFLLPAGGIAFAVSLLSLRGVRRLALIGFAVGYVLMLATLLVGPEVKGATRWLYIAGISVQPSEFVKPFFVVVAAWLFAEQRRHGDVPGDAIALALLVLVLGCLVLQPDYGMTAVVATVWGAQIFVAGLSLVWIGALAALAAGGAGLAYLYVPHVTSRIDRFLSPEGADTYQVDTALRAFADGGLLGRGPGEGVVKRVIPDAHTDFIFAVAAEEYGVIVCLLIVALFAFIVLRGFSRLVRQDNLFVMLAAGGLLIQFGLQALINIGVNLNLLPTKGMTLPFISYGGSSLIALALAMGMVLALTRRRAHLGDDG
jgi:cell division protein FtsW